MAKNQLGDKKLESKLFDLTEDELLTKMPDKDDFEEVLPPSKGPLEVRVAEETKAGSMNADAVVKDTNPPPPQTTPPTTNGHNKDESVKPKPKVEEKKEPVKTVSEGDITFTIPDKKEKEPVKTTQQTQQDNQNKSQPQTENQQFGSPDLSPPDFGSGKLDDDIWKIADLGKGAKGATGATSDTNAGNNSGGVDMPNEVMSENVTDLAETAIILYDAFVLAGLKDRVKIDIPNFIGEMFAQDIRHDYQQDYLRYLIEYNTSIDNDFKQSPQVRAALKHAIKILLNKYEGFADSIGPEFQAIALIGNVVMKDYKKSNRWMNPGKTLLSQMDDRLAQTPKNAPVQQQKTESEKGSNKKAEAKGK